MSLGRERLPAYDLKAPTKWTLFHRNAFEKNFDKKLSETHRPVPLRHEATGSLSITVRFEYIQEERLKAQLAKLGAYPS